MKYFIHTLIFFAIFNIVSAQTNNTFLEKIETVPTDSINLEGTLLTKSKKDKLVIIIAGSGPTDRNGNSTAGVSSNTYLMIANELAKNNIASFRFDKRGIGKSSYPNFKEETLSFDDYVYDVVTIYNYFNKKLGYKKIYLAGHSEGSLIGMIAAEKTKAKGYVSIAGAGRPINKIIVEQVNKQSPIIGKQTDSLFNILIAKHTIDSVPPYLVSIFRPSVQPYMLSWIKYNPAEEITKLKCSILLLQGSCDIQVSPLESEILQAANSNSKLVLLDGMTHTLKNAEANCSDKNLKTYHDKSLLLNEKFVKELVNFIKAN